MQAIAIVSGGLDSVTLAYLLKSQGYALHLLSFDYGQRHVKELNAARLVAVKLGARHTVVDLRTITPLLRGSALTDAIDVPDGHYTADNMRVTIVPNRNAVMLAIAYAAAVADGARMVGIGVHAGDHAVYPDCRPEFIKAFEAMEQRATEQSIALLAPFLYQSKAEIVRTGARLGVPFKLTWSCYKGEAQHCGTCGTCVERREAFLLANVPDPTEYQNKEQE